MSDYRPSRPWDDWQASGSKEHGPEVRLHLFRHNLWQLAEAAYDRLRLAPSRHDRERVRGEIGRWCWPLNLAVGGVVGAVRYKRMIVGDGGEWPTQHDIDELRSIERKAAETDAGRECDGGRDLTICEAKR